MIQDMHADETLVEMTLDEKFARLQALNDQMVSRAIGLIPDRDETQEYFELKKELTPLRFLVARNPSDSECATTRLND